MTSVRHDRPCGLIDKKLARGLTRDVFREVDRRWGERDQRADVANKLSNPKARARALMRMKRSLLDAGLFLGMAASPDYRRVAYGSFCRFETGEDWPVLLVTRCTGEYDRRGLTRTVDNRAIAAVNAHAIQRFFERTGAQSLDAFMWSMRGAFGWCRALLQTGHSGPAMIPMGPHLIGLRVEKVPRIGRCARIVTFLPDHGMTNFQKRVRAALDPMTAATPDFPGLRPVSEDALALAATAQQFGREWLSRSGVAAQAA